MDIYVIVDNWNYNKGVNDVKLRRQNKTSNYWRWNIKTCVKIENKFKHQVHGST